MRQPFLTYPRTPLCRGSGIRTATQNADTNGAFVCARSQGQIRGGGSRGDFGGAVISLFGSNSTQRLKQIAH